MLLTAVEPLCLPVIRVVRDVLLPDATEAHIAEILMSGLLRETAGGDADAPPFYEWRSEMREEMRAISGWSAHWR